MGTIMEPFEFRECVSILKSTGRKAQTLRELMDVIATVSDGSISHHTHQYFLKGHILEYTNDFAHWAGEYLEERALAEELSNIDPYACADVGELREVLTETIDGYLGRFPEPRAVRQGDEFHFNETVSLIFPAGIRAKNLAEFLMAIKYVDAGSIFYHFYDARLRLGAGLDDFSKWFIDVLGKEALGEKIQSIDPFMHSIEGIRERVASAVEGEVKKDMMELGGEQ